VELSQLSKDRQTRESLVAAYLGTTLKRKSLTSHFKHPQLVLSGGSGFKRRSQKQTTAIDSSVRVGKRHSFMSR